MTTRTTEEVALELLTRAHGRDAEGADTLCVAGSVLSLAGVDAGHDGYGSELLRRAAADYMAASLPT